MMIKMEYWVDKLNLQKHPEGGYFKETYRSEESIDASLLDGTIEGVRSLSTGIYFLLERSNFSAFHRIKSDEMWHFYEGASLCVHMINEKGEYSKQMIGRNLEQGELFQFVVPANTWFASEVIDGDYSLVGCTVAFGFDFRDFELATKELMELFPDHAVIIQRLIR